MPLLNLRGRQTGQPRHAARLDARNRLTHGAQAILTANSPVNIVSGRPLTVSGLHVPYRANVPGLSARFQHNAYRVTEVFEAIGTKPFVEFWIGYPSGSNFARGNTGEPGFATGSTNNSTGIAIGIGNIRNAANPSHWGSLHMWAAASDGLVMCSAGEALVTDKLVCLVTVRRANSTELWRDGKLVATDTRAPSVVYGASGFIVGGFIEDLGYWTSNNDMVMAGRLLAEWSPAEVRSFCANPWQLLKTGDELMSYIAAGLSKRALIMSSGQLAEITDAQLGTNLKPLVIYNGDLRQRSVAEGSPLVLDAGTLRALASGETLLL